MMEQLINKVALDGLHHHHLPSSPHDPLESIHGSSDSGNMSGGEMSPELLKADYADIKNQVQNTIRAGSKRSPAEIEEAIMRKKLRNRESAQRARDRQKARMRWLEEEVTRITGKNDQMLKENLLLRQVLGEQGQKINELLRREEERQRRNDKDTDSESRVSVKTERKEETVIEEDEEPAPKKPALWRPGLDTPSKPKRSTTDDHLSKMRLNIIQDHTLPSSLSTTSTTPSYAGLGFDQSRLTMPTSMPYFPLGAGALSHNFQAGSLTNDSLLLAQRIRQSQVISGEQ